ncbi:MAG: MtnX-like HAD-IB family phosphatase [Dehalococcoidales bacterium]
MKTLLQCDFDGTITTEDVSFLILDAYGDRGWRRMFQDYKDGKISVGRFNTLAFATVREDREILLDLVRKKARLRPGFRDLVAFCQDNNVEFAIVSNGLDFYIRAILQDIGMEDVRVFSATTRFVGGAVEARYIGPEGTIIEDRFKDAYLTLFQQEGYSVIYAGNGISDAGPAKQAYHCFATGDLLAYFKKNGVDFTPFEDLNDIVDGLRSLKLA